MKSKKELLQEIEYLKEKNAELVAMTVNNITREDKLETQGKTQAKMAGFIRGEMCQFFQQANTFGRNIIGRENYNKYEKVKAYARMQINALEELAGNIYVNELRKYSK